MWAGRWFLEGFGGGEAKKGVFQAENGRKSCWWFPDAAGVFQKWLVRSFSENGGFREMLKRFWET